MHFTVRAGCICILLVSMTAMADIYTAIPCLQPRPAGHKPLIFDSFGGWMTKDSSVRVVQHISGLLRVVEKKTRVVKREGC